MPRRTSNSGVKERRRAWSPYEEPVGFLRGAGWCRQAGERAGRLYLPPRETRVAQARSEEEQTNTFSPLYTAAAGNRCSQSQTGICNLVACWSATGRAVGGCCWKVQVCPTINDGCCPVDSVHQGTRARVPKYKSPKY